MLHGAVFQKAPLAAGGNKEHGPRQNGFRQA